MNGNYAQLQQALMNLLQNAKQAMQESGIGQTLTVRVVRGPAGQVHLEVQDDGPGISEAIQSRIFDPFFTTKPPGKGTGLGLAIVSGVIREHRGTIQVFSQPKKGARFVMNIPTAEHDTQLPQAAPRNAAPAGFDSNGEGAAMFAGRGNGSGRFDGLCESRRSRAACVLRPRRLRCTDAPDGWATVFRGVGTRAQSFAPPYSVRDR